VFYALQNLTTVEELYEIWGWVLNPETGEWEYRVIETGERRAPPEWWGETITIVGVVAALAAAAVVAVVVIPRILPERPALT
ncbi:unnamed protein product, partial [marine sediment metagenome]